MTRMTFVKFGTFAVVMFVLTAFLFATFGEYRSGSTNQYSAVFADASRLEPGDSVRAAGIKVGTVDHVSAMSDDTVLVQFDADRVVVITDGTKAAVRYLNLVGDRYLELIDGPGSTQVMSAGGQIPLARTSPALDLDLLLSGLKPVIRGLNPQDVNALTASLLQIFQGQGDNLESLLSRTSSFSDGLASANTTIQSLIDKLTTVVDTLNDKGDQFRGTIDRLEKLVSQLSTDRDPIATAIDALGSGTASIADLLTKARPPLNGAVDELNRTAPLLYGGKDQLDVALQKMPENYRKLSRLGAYGSFVNYYICGVSLRVTDLQGRTAVFPWFKQTTGRCGEP